MDQLILDPEPLRQSHQQKSATFSMRRPHSAALASRGAVTMPDGVPMAWMAGLFRHPTLFVTDGKGSRFFDADGISFIDFNLADLSNTVGYGDKNAQSPYKVSGSLASPGFG